MTKMLVSLIFVLGALYISVYAFAASLSDKMIFPKPPPSYEDGAGSLKLETSEGDTITVLYLEAPDSTKLLLYSHGNGEDLGMIQHSLEAFAQQGISVLAYDYPGYGTSSGKPSESGVYAAADAVYTYATQTLNFAPETIVLYGYSLGSGPSCWLAERYPIDRLILEGAFTSTFHVVSRIKLLPFDKFDNRTRLPKIQCPKLIIHGTKDRIIPFSHAKKNWQLSTGEKQKLWVEDAGHNNLVETAGKLYWETVIPFILSMKNSDDVELIDTVLTQPSTDADTPFHGHNPVRL